MNILLLSVGTRNKIVQYFKRALGGDGLVVATDMSALAPALYDADRHYLVPRITEEGYLNRILDICRKEQISGVLSLIDPELSLLAEHREQFAQVGATVIGSPYELCERSLDKYEMYQWLTDHGYRRAKSYVELESFCQAMEGGAISFPVIVKPIRGSASLSIAKAENWDDVEFLFRRAPEMMIQEYLDGQEIGADVYIDLISGQTVSIFTKKKLLMRAGETDKAVSFQDKDLFVFIEGFVTEMGYRGQIDIDLFEIDGAYYISEVNPRFGGGYPHAYECGCDHMKLILENLKGKANQRNIGHYDEKVYMMKYSEIYIQNWS